MNRSNIQEANRHLQALYDRIDELETVVHQQNDMIASKDSFVQIKIRELSAQDQKIYDMQNQLSMKDELINQSKLTIRSLEKEIKSKDREISARTTENSVLREKNRLLFGVLQLAPELSKILSQFENVSQQIQQIDTDGYVEVNGVVADDGDRTNTRHVATESNEQFEHTQITPSLEPESSYETREEKNGREIEGNINHSSTIKFPHTDEMYTQSVGDMARTFLRTGISSQFSVSEDDVIGDGSDMSTPGQPNKEVYF